jgi:hypothetical protein
VQHLLSLRSGRDRKCNRLKDGVELGLGERTPRVVFRVELGSLGDALGRILLNAVVVEQKLEKNRQPLAVLAQRVGSRRPSNDTFLKGRNEYL